MKLLSVGAGSEQVPGILKAKQKGYYVIAIDANENAEGLSLADEGYVLDIKLKDKILEFLEDKNIKGIIQSPIGRYLTTIGAINDKFNFKGISEKSAILCTDKLKTNEVLTNHNISCAKQLLAKGKDDILNKIKKMGLPCVLKPRFGSGSKGVVVIENEYNIDFLIEEHLNFNIDDFTLVESLLYGQEYAVDAIVINGMCKVILNKKKYMTKGFYRQEIGYLMTDNLNEQSKINIDNTMQKVATAIGLENCLVQADILIKDNKVSIIEISGRPTGLNISSKIIPLVTGIDYLGLGIDMILGEIKLSDIIINYKKNTGYALYYLDIENKVVKLIPNLDYINSQENIIEYENNIKIGDALGEIKNGSDILNRGYIVVKSKNEEDGLKLLDDVKNQFKFM